MNEWFKIGEEVQYITNPTARFVVTHIDKDGLISGIGLDGIAFVDKNPRRWERTGRYFRQAEELMDELKEQSTTEFFMDEYQPTCKACGFRPFAGYIPTLEWMKERRFNFCPRCGKKVKWE